VTSQLRLRTKFLLSMLLVSGSLTAAALLVVQDRVRRHVEEDLSAQLHSSAQTFQNFHQRQQALAQRMALLVADLPNLKAVMTTQDPATIQDASAGVSQVAGGSVFVLADRSGRIVGVHPEQGGLRRESAERLFRQSLQAGERHAWWFADGHLYEVILQPINTGPSENSTELGVLAYGNEIDHALAEDVRHIALGEVAFRYGDTTVVSTLPQGTEADFARSKIAGTNGGPTRLWLGGEEYLASTVRLDEEGGAPVHLVVLTSYDHATAFLVQLNRLILVVGFVALLAGSALVFLISDTFTRPLRGLLVGVAALEKGDFLYPLEAHGSDEAAQLTSAFDRMRHSLRKSQETLLRAARMEALGQLAGGVAHDFNNLVTIINGYAELVLVKLEPDSPLVRYLNEIKKAGTRASGLTHQLLAFSRKQVLETHPIDLNGVLTNMHKMLRVLIGEDIDLVMAQAAALPQIMGDPTQVEQVVMNLAANARDAMPRGGKLTMETSVFNVPQGEGTAELLPGKYVRLAVSDTGTGIDEETQRHIFEPFFTTKEVGKGTGLGLATVYGITRQSGGAISVYSEVGQGTTFKLYFPALAEKMKTAEKAEAPVALAAGTETILVVEDENAVRSLAREALETQGYRVLDAQNGAVALQVAQTHAGEIHLLITDVVMPVMSGRDLAEQLVKIRPGLRVLYMSGYTERAVTDHGISSQMAFVQKPFTPTGLVRRVQDLLSGEGRRGAGAS
jgi:signal transduction histidine kinase